MMAPFVFGFAVWVFANENGAFSRILTKRLFVQLGVWSYSIYMVHWLVRTAIKIVVATFSGRPLGTQSPLDGIDGNWAVSAIILAYLITVVVVSALTYRLIEAPGRKYFNLISEALARKEAH
jgi:peptidoglycan/LPS O-acetylase OafA/YrhL